MLFFFLLGELVIRIHYRLSHNIAILNFSSLAPHDRLGWHGMQSIGDLTNTTRPRILIVGDSMTQGLGMARDDQLYFNVLRQLPQR